MKVSISKKYVYTVFADGGFKFTFNAVLNELTWDEVATLNILLDGKAFSFESIAYYELSDEAWKKIFNKHQVPE